VRVPEFRSNRRKQIWDLAQKGDPPRVIAQTLSMQTSGVSQVLRVWRRNGYSIPSFVRKKDSKPITMLLTLPADVSKKIASFSALYGLSRKVLVQELVKTVMREDLFHAIMDE
jgi:hypothetical protein